MPAVSIIIPTYNRAFFLKECIEAILSQKFQDFELIVVDDGSEDDTEKVLDEYRKSLIVVRQDNRGVSCARNQGIKIAKGDYLAFCDSDDLWLTKKLTEQMAAFEDQKIMVCYTEEIWVRNGKRVNQRMRHRKSSGWLFEKCLELCIVSPSSVMMRREFFDKVGLFDEKLPACEDYDLWLRASLLFPFHFISTPLITKRGGHYDQLSRKYWGMDRFRVKAIEKCLKKSLTVGQKQRASEVLIKKCSILANGAEKRGRKQEAIYYRKLIAKWQVDDGASLNEV